MRKNKSMCVTSQWLLLMLFALSTGRSLDAAVVSIRRFRLRNRLSVRVITHRGTKKRSELQEVADKFSRTITYNLEMVGLIAGIQGADRYESVFNMDQTSIYIDMGPKRTTELNLSEPKMWMLFKECHKTRLKAYCDEERMIEWIKEVWKPSVTAPRLLLLDSLKSHRINSIVARAWRAVRTKVIVRGFIEASIVPYGPRDADGKFVVDAPEEVDDIVIEEEYDNNED
ncbi:hypothetical protein PC118_g18744 [Phytophthora cactorum]|uniref:DDE-1 domain-containing protein n=1 Tax=Phytophthora cactorum TaxID=29920 RepID=A0A8T1F2W7_9STRA|nr:hypothetical protein PC118_g18744 [Phytophthora cactorum]